MKEENQAAPALEEQEEEQEEQEEQEEEQGEQESLEEYKARLQKAEELAENYKRRAEKAEKKAKSAPSTPKAETSHQLTPKDYLALQEAGITAQDFDEVQDFANYRKVSISEALSSPTLKTILAERKEERMTAQATAVKGPRGTKPKSGEEYLEKARTTGEIPTDSKALQELILAKQNSRRTRK